MRTSSPSEERCARSTPSVSRARFSASAYRKTRGPSRLTTTRPRSRSRSSSSRRRAASHSTSWVPSPSSSKSTVRRQSSAISVHSARQADSAACRAQPLDRRRRGSPTSDEDLDVVVTRPQNALWNQRGKGHRVAVAVAPGDRRDRSVDRHREGLAGRDPLEPPRHVRRAHASALPRAAQERAPAELRIAYDPQLVDFRPEEDGIGTERVDVVPPTGPEETHLLGERATPFGQEGAQLPGNRLAVLIRDRDAPADRTHGAE